VSRDYVTERRHRVGEGLHNLEGIGLHILCHAVWCFGIDHGHHTIIRVETRARRAAAPKVRILVFCDAERVLARMRVLAEVCLVKDALLIDDTVPQIRAPY
jgi:hypothetical protein